MKNNNIRIAQEVGQLSQGGESAAACEPDKSRRQMHGLVCDTLAFVEPENGAI